MNAEVIEKLKNRYYYVHPLIFLRSVEHAKDVGELFDMLENLPSKYPVMWEETVGHWVTCDPIRLNELKKIVGK
jgi:hypothetical protein